MQSANTPPGTDCGTDHELLVAKLQVKLRKMEKNSNQKLQPDMTLKRYLN